MDGQGNFMERRSCGECSKDTWRYNQRFSLDNQGQMANVVKEGGKILLKINLETDSVSFGFKSIGDRDRIISVIKDMAVKKPTGLSVEEIQARQTLLEQRPELRKIHRDLVMGNVITEDEFWSTRTNLLEEQRWQNQQKRGTSSVLLADIKPADGDGTDLKFTLNSDTIHSIFTQYPGVHRAYLDHVPVKMTEKEFWTLYFSSKYFHRNRVVASNKNQVDIFEPYLKEMEADTVLHPLIAFESKNRLLDLTTTAENIADKGNGPDRTMKPGSFKDSLPLIRKFNRHSKLILEATGSTKKQKVVHDAKEILKETVLDDLEPPKEPEDVPLAIVDASTYFDMGSKSDATANGTTSMDVELPDLDLKKVSLAYQISFASLSSNELIHKLSTRTVLHHPTAVDLSPRVLQESLNVHQAGNELLRHFWASLLTPSRVPAIAKALQELQNKIDVTKNSMAPFEKNQYDGLVVTLQLGIETALERFKKM